MNQCRTQSADQVKVRKRLEPQRFSKTEPNIHRPNMFPKIWPRSPCKNICVTNCQGLNKLLCQACRARVFSKEKELNGPSSVFCARKNSPFMINRFLTTVGSISKRLGRNSVIKSPPETSPPSPLKGELKYLSKYNLYS